MGEIVTQRMCGGEKGPKLPKYRQQLGSRCETNLTCMHRADAEQRRVCFENFPQNVVALSKCEHLMKQRAQLRSVHW